MCGIVGYIGKKTAFPMLCNGLKKLEYRGYDSFGFAVINDKQSLIVEKTIGKISDSKINIKEKASIGIAHTRWATHGGVTEDNAHPHTSCDNKTAIVHNGIIENYESIKEELISKGHEFKSNTDTEVIPHLIEELLEKNNFKDAVFKTANKLEGSYAFLAINTHSPDEMIAIRKESPIAVGVSNDGFLIASDTLPFTSVTDKVFFMNDYEAAVINDNKIEFYDFRDGTRVKKTADKITLTEQDLSKNGFDHFLIKEIYEQPISLKKTLKQDDIKLREVARLINASPRVIIIGCGTSRYASLVGRYAISEIAGKFCEVIMASEFHHFLDKVGKDALIIAVSQSGETADVLMPVRLAKKQGCKVVSIVNVKESSLDKLSDVSLYLNCGPEISVASTKAFTSQTIIFYLLAYTLNYTLDKKLPELEALSDKITETIKLNEAKIKKLAQYLKDKPDMYYIARAINFAVASEGSLKMKEISYLHAEGMPAGELKHGTLALIDKGTPVIAIAPHDHTYKETIDNVHETKARGAFTIGITDHPNKVFDESLIIPEIDPIHYPILANIPCQLLAYYTAVACNRDVDKPRNLAKSVTVR